MPFSKHVGRFTERLEQMQQLDKLVMMAAEDIQDIVNGRRDMEFSKIYNRQYICILYGYGDKLYDVIKSAIRRTALSRDWEQFHSTVYVIESVSTYLANVFLPKHELPSLHEYAEEMWDRPVSFRWRRICSAVRKLPHINRMRLLFDEYRFRPGCSGMLQCQTNFNNLL